MEILKFLAEWFGGKALDGAATELSTNRYWRPSFLACRLIDRGADIRVSFSAILRIESQQRYLLVRNLHRPETFCPFGGVYKYDAAARRALDGFDFRPHYPGTTQDADLDIRGFLPRRRLIDMLKWFEQKVDRESPDDCLKRELREELEEVGLGVSVTVEPDLGFRLVRAVDHGPAQASGQSYTQYRIFEVYDLHGRNGAGERMCRTLCDAAAKTPGLLLVSADEIRRGRAADGSIIGHHTAYLLGTKALLPDVPMFNGR